MASRNTKTEYTQDQYLLIIILFLYYVQANTSNNQLYCTNQLLLSNTLQQNNALIQNMICRCGRT